MIREDYIREGLFQLELIEIFVEAYCGVIDSKELNYFAEKLQQRIEQSKKSIKKWR